MKPNPILTLAAATAAALALGSLGACSKVGTHSDAAHVSMAASPSAQLIGTTPADPSGDPPGTTPVTPDNTNVPKNGDTEEGQNNSHSTLAADSSQKSGG